MAEGSSVIMMALLLALLSLWVAWSIAREAYEEWRDARGWRRVNGVVTSSTVREEPRQSERGFHVGLGVEVRYRYEIEGVRYDGMHHFADGGQPGARRISKELLRYFRPGAPIRLHYDPAHPGEAKLLPRELGIGTQLGCLLTLVLLTIGAYLAAWL